MPKPSKAYVELHRIQFSSVPWARGSLQSRFAFTVPGALVRLQPRLFTSNGCYSFRGCLPPIRQHVKLARAASGLPKGYGHSWESTTAFSYLGVLQAAHKWSRTLPMGTDVFFLWIFIFGQWPFSIFFRCLWFTWIIRNRESPKAVLCESLPKVAQKRITAEKP